MIKRILQLLKLELHPLNHVRDLEDRDKKQVNKIVSLKKEVKLLDSRVREFERKEILEKYKHLDLAFTAPKVNLAEMKKIVKERDGTFCSYCDKDLQHRLKDLTIDHVIPKAQGGCDTLENLVVACRSCNQKKAANSLSQRELKALFAKVASRSQR